MVKSTISTATKKHQDRGLAARAAFEKASVEIQTAQTMMLLLPSKEDMVVVQTLSSLDKYASKLEQNAQTLYEGGILPLIIPLLSHDDLLIKRFAYKLLSELTFLPPVSEILLQDQLIAFLAEALKNTDDHIVTEFSTSILAQLTKTTLGKSQLISTNSINIFIPLLTSTDPDIQKNSLEVIFNVVGDPYDQCILTQCEDFKVKVLIDLLESEYVAIQNLALDVLKIIMEKRKENPVPKNFQEAGGIGKILGILERLDWKDVHAKSLDILGNIYDDTGLAQHFLTDGVLRLFTYMDFVNDPLLRRKAVEVISKIANTSLGRQVLRESDKIDKITGMLTEQTVGIAMAVSECVSGLARDHEALQLMLASDTLAHLLEIAHDQERDWGTRTAAIKALSDFITRESNVCALIVDSDKNDVFSRVLRQFDENVPIDAAITAANCVRTLGERPELRRQVATIICISALLHCFDDFPEDTTALKVAACEALCTLLSEAETRRCLREENGLEKVWASLTRQPRNMQLMQSAATFIHVCVSSDYTLTPILLRLNVLDWLLSRSSLRNECPVWEVAMQTVLTKFLPLKFAMTGRLELTDITESNFYVTKKPLTLEQLRANAFPVLDSLINDGCCPFRTLYVANFRPSEGKEFRGQSIVLTGHLMSFIPSQSSLESLRVRLTDDYLINYLDSLKSIFIKNRHKCEESGQGEFVMDAEAIRGKALLIGEFVAKQLSGLDKTEVCSQHAVDLHVNELKVELMNSIVPIGHMRVGMHLERAFLFKVLADRVGLPVSLVRGEYSQRAWVELAIPKLPPAPRPSYPHHLLKPNFLVDLMSTPVTLHPLGSYEADKYCGLR